MGKVYQTWSRPVLEIAQDYGPFHFDFASAQSIKGQMLLRLVGRRTITIINK